MPGIEALDVPADRSDASAHVEPQRGAWVLKFHHRMSAGADGDWHVTTRFAAVDGFR